MTNDNTGHDAMLVTLSYVSKALIHEDDPALNDILATAQRRNAAADVTGALYFDGSLFFQVLEGPDEAVQEIYAAIRRDPRHKEVRLLKLQDLLRRRFTDWSMKFVPAAALPPETPRVIHHALHRPDDLSVDAAIDALR
jgi:hypothetical protein